MGYWTVGVKIANYPNESYPSRSGSSLESMNGAPAGKRQEIFSARPVHLGGFTQVIG
jgi:hypothetical protein